jgi:hypothetical protein
MTDLERPARYSEFSWITDSAKAVSMVSAMYSTPNRPANVVGSSKRQLALVE